MFDDYPSSQYQSDYHKRFDENEKEKRGIAAETSSPRAFVAVILCWLFGVAFTELFILGGFGVSVPVMVMLFYGIALWYLRGKDTTPAKGAYVLLIPIALISFGYVMTDNSMTFVINTLVLLVLIPLQLALLSGTTVGDIFSMQSAYHTLNSTVVIPITNMNAPFKALAGSKDNKDGVKNKSKFSMAFLGLLIAIPLVAIFMALFSSADRAFDYYVASRIEEYFSIGNLIFDVIFGAFVAIAVAAWFITLRGRSTPSYRTFKRNHNLDSTLVSTVLLMLNLVQLAFVAIQFRYLFSRNMLPKGMTYAEYARSGFFELCTVLCFSVIIIMLCMLFAKRDASDKLSKPVSVLLSVFILCNYVVVISAIYRMLAYIQVYDLTVKRVMVTWLIVVFALSLLGAIIKIWSPKFKITNYIATAVIIMTILLNVANINSVIANYNVDRFIDHSKAGNQTFLSDIDVEYLGHLGPAATGATQRLYNYSKAQGKNTTTIQSALDAQRSKLNRKTWHQFCFTDIEARRILGKQSN